MSTNVLPPTPITKLLVANRGEIAVRIIRAAHGLGMSTVAVHTADDTAGRHLTMADEVAGLAGRGVGGYLDIDAVVAAAVAHGVDAVHPGYGFLAENATFARRCHDVGIGFVGPDADTLELFGDKVTARRVAASAGLRILEGSDQACTIEQAEELLTRHGAIMLKAVAGGGGRGMRAVRSVEELAPAWERCASEALKAFGNADVYVEQLVEQARHIEVQIVGDGSGAVVHLGERDCSVQRRNQKLIEIAPAPHLADDLRRQICDAATRLGQRVEYANVGTVEFLVDASWDGPAEDTPFWFIECNPRIQVEHTVTEETTGIDLVQTQLRLAGGADLEQVGLGRSVPPRGWAIQARVNAETFSTNGQTLPSTGTVTAFELASGPGVRVDAAGYAGLVVGAGYDSLLAKLIVHRPSGSFAEAAEQLYRALCESRIDGVDTNLELLRGVVRHPGLAGASTAFFDEHLAEFLGGDAHPVRRPPVAAAEAVVAPSRAGAALGSDDPLAVLAFGRSATTSSSTETSRASPPVPDGHQLITTPLQGTVVSIEVQVGGVVRAGQLVAVVEAMKMEHEVHAKVSGEVTVVHAGPGDILWADQALVTLVPAEVAGEEASTTEAVDLDEIRASLAEVLELRGRMMDDARPAATARRHDVGKRTARENVDDLVDDGTFVEWGPMALAAQRSRRSREDLIERSPADGLITGVGSINGHLFDDPTNRCAVMVYDYTVFAGTQGIRNHAKTDRIIDIATEGRMPFVLFAEGGGGRPGDTDGGDFGSRTFSRFATMSGLVPMVGVVSGRCFAGNASLLGCCDVIIATKDINLGMGGPAMIEGGGLGVFRPEEIGPAEVHVANGVVDVLVDDEAEATAVARKYLSYFQGPVADWEAHDQRHLRRIIPENRLRTYDVRELIDTLADVDSVLELKPGFGFGMVTALIRVEGKPLGLIANNPNHLGGAIDSDGADKAARFMSLCDTFDVPIMFLCDTPGIMVGPEIEKTALVRHSSRMFLIGANLDIPTFTVIVRKSYGLGGIAMAGGSYRVPIFSVAWPTAEFGPMGLEGSVKLGYRAELAAIEDPEARKARYEELVAKEYRRGGALNYATAFAVDDTIDPAETRYWLANVMSSIRPPAPREGKKRSSIDGW